MLIVWVFHLGTLAFCSAAVLLFVSVQSRLGTRRIIPIFSIFFFSFFFIYFFNKKVYLLLACILLSSSLFSASSFTLLSRTDSGGALGAKYGYGIGGKIKKETARNLQDGGKGGVGELGRLV